MLIVAAHSALENAEEAFNGVGRYVAAPEAPCIETDFHIYENTGHAFVDPDQKRYVEASANDAWIHMTAFLTKHMGQLAAAPMINVLAQAVAGLDGTTLAHEHRSCVSSVAPEYSFFAEVVSSYWLLRCGVSARDAAERKCFTHIPTAGIIAVPERA